MSELSEEQSIQFAAHFELLKMCLFSMDWDYAEKLVRGLDKQAGWQETVMIFNPGYPSAKNDLLRIQTEALSKFVEAVKLLKKCDELKRKIEPGKNAVADVQKMFL